MRIVPTLTLGLALLGSAAAIAQPAAPPAPPSATTDARPERGPRADRGPRPDRGGRMFELIDANRDGRITWEESWTFVTARFTAADTDRSGGLSIVEFATLRMRPANAPQPRPEQAARMEDMQGRMFRGLDANRDGQVTLEEIRPFVEARFRSADANGDGAVVREEMPQRGPHHGPHHGPRGGDAPAVPPAAAPSR